MMYSSSGEIFKVIVPNKVTVPKINVCSPRRGSGTYFRGWGGRGTHIRQNVLVNNIQGFHGFPAAQCHGEQ